MFERRLAAWPHSLVFVSCSRCPRRGRYRKAALVERHGDAVPLAELARRIAGACAAGPACGAHLLDHAPPELRQLAWLARPPRFLTAGEARRALMRYSAEMPLVIERPGGGFARIRAFALVTVDERRPGQRARDGTPALLLQTE
ncbi:MAG: hypothetical protein AB7O45_05700 [Alphaproteobacteria bacterium]